MLLDPTLRNIVVMGASAGGVEALQRFFGALSSDVPAAFLVVVHLSPHAPSQLAGVLRKVTRMRVKDGEDGEALRRSTIYVASSDRHLMLDADGIRITRGPKECRSRPAVDVLFRSAAESFGSRVIGCVMSGALDDGTAGLWAVRDRGGLAMAQDPGDARFESMPASAIAHVAVDFVGSAEALAGKVSAASATTAATGTDPGGAAERHAVENLIARAGNGLQAGIMKLGPVSTYTCPDCHGVLVQIEEGSIVRFRCHTGHAFSLQTLLAEVNAAIDNGLWDTVRAIEERVLLLRQTADLSEKGGAGAAADRMRRQADDAERRLQPLRDLVLDPGFFGHEPPGE